MPTADENSAGDEDEDASASQGETKTNSVSNSLTDTEDFHRLSRGLQKWAERHESGNEHDRRRRGSSSTDNSPEISLHDFCDATIVQEEKDKKMTAERKGSSASDLNNSTAENMSRRDSSTSKNRFANKVLGRLYNRRAFASGLVFSRGHFLGDIEKMVEGLLSSHSHSEEGQQNCDELEQFGFGDNEDTLSLDTMTIHEQEGGQHTAHSSTLAAGKDGCVVLILPKASLIPFLDAHPGLLLSLLGTQVVV